MQLPSQDTIIDIDYSANTDILRFKPDVSATDLTLAQRGNNLVVQINGITDSVTIKDFFKPSYYLWYARNTDFINAIEAFAFSDSATRSFEQIKEASWKGTDADDRFVGDRRNNSMGEIPTEIGVMQVQVDNIEILWPAPKKPITQLPFGIWMALVKAVQIRAADLSEADMVDQPGLPIGAQRVNAALKIERLAAPSPPLDKGYTLRFQVWAVNVLGQQLQVTFLDALPPEVFFPSVHDGNYLFDHLDCRIFCQSKGPRVG